MQSYEQLLTAPLQKELFNINRAKFIQEHWNELSPQISPFCGGSKPSIMEMKKCFDKFVSLHERINDDISSRRVVYRKKYDNKGRLFADHSISLQGIARPIRHSITEGIYVDLDMVNAHPTILKQMMEAEKLDTTYITEYVNNRDKCIQEVCENYNAKNAENKMSRDSAKAYFLIIINNGNDNDDTSYEWKNMTFYSVFSANLSQEMEKAREHFSSGIYADRFKEFCKYRKSKKQENHKGGWMNFLICEKENQALTEIRRFFDFNENMVLVFDGAMIPKELHDRMINKNINGDFDYEPIKIKIFVATGLEIKLSAKPLEFIIPEVITAPKYIEPIYEFYNDYPHFTGSDKEMTLEKLHDWTKKCFKIVNNGGKKLIRVMHKSERMGRTYQDVNYFNIMDYDKGLKDLTSKCLVINPNSDPEKYKKARTKEDRKPYAPYMFETLREYIDDRQSNNLLEIYDSVEFTPYLHENLTSPGAFNLFTGFPLKNKKPTTGFDFYKTKFYEMLLNNLMSGNKDECEHFLNTLADAIQDGAVPKRNAHVIITPQGGGKGALLMWMTNVFGPQNTVCIDDINRYFEKFNSFTTSRLIKVFEENSEGGAAFNYADRLKNHITGHHEISESKGGEQEKMNNCARFILFSNHSDDVANYQGDTRITVHNTKSPNCNNQVYFNPIWREISDPQFSVDCFHFLMNKKYRHESVNQCFHTDAKDQQKIQQMKSGFKFISEYVQDFFLNRPEWKTASKDSSMFRFVANDLNDKYKEINKGKRVDNGTLGKQLLMLGIKSFPVRTYNGENRGQQRCYTLYPPDLEEAIRKAIGVETYKLDLEQANEEIKEQQSDFDIEEIKERIKLTKIMLEREEKKLEELMTKK